MNNKRTILLIIATLATLVLAAIAVVTSLKLKQVATVPVTPNAPVSKPQAAEVSDMVCQTSFVVKPSACFEVCQTDSDCESPYSCDTTSKKCVNPSCPTKSNCTCQPGLSCVDKKVYRDESSNTAGTYQLLHELTDGAEVSRGQQLVFVVSYENTGEANVSGTTITDVLAPTVQYKDGQTGCNYAAATRTVSCTVGAVAANGTGNKAFRVTVLSDAAAGDIANVATVTPKEGTASTCDAKVTIVVPTPSPTPSPTPVPACNSACTEDGQCPSDLVCDGGKCRNDACTSRTDCVCPTSTPTPTPKPTPAPGCNTTCTVGDSSSCPENLTCDSSTSRCRNPECTGQTNCACPAAATPVPTSLPRAGNPLPGFLFVAVGGLLVIAGVLVVGL